MVAYNRSRFEDKIDFEESLAEIREAMGPAPRRFSWWSRLTYLRIRQPGWAQGDDLRRFFPAVRSLLARGRVTWGHIVQANELLFEPGKDNCPGEVIYGREACGTMLPDELEPIAQALFALKGTQPDDPGERAVADHLTNERTRAFGLAVPPHVSAPHRCQLSTIFFDRKHLPDEKLSRSFLPLLVSANGDGTVMVVPARFWPERLVREWR